MPDVSNFTTCKAMLEALGIRFTESRTGGYIYIPLQKIPRGWPDDDD